MIGLILLGVALVISYLIYEYLHEDSKITFVKSNVDGKEYLVRNLLDKQKASDLLAYINQRVQKLINFLLKKYPNNSEIKRLYERYDSNSLSEGTYNKKYTTYTLNKGSKIVYCLRKRDGSKQLHDINLLMFVTIHELAHIMSNSTNHTDEFQHNFKLLAEEAVSCHVYVPQNYQNYPEKYCGILITQTPLSFNIIN